MLKKETPKLEIHTYIRNYVKHLFENDFFFQESIDNNVKAVSNILNVPFSGSLKRAEKRNVENIKKKLTKLPFAK